MADKEKPAKAAGAPKGGAPQKAKSRKGEKKAAASKEPRQPAAPRPKDYKPRMKSHYEKVVREALPKKFGYKNHMQVPKIEKIVLNMGIGEGRQRSQEGRQRRRRSGAHRRPAPGADQVAQVDRHLQGARRHDARRQGDAARRPHVRVPRPLRHHRAAAREGLPRPEPEELRRPRQLSPAVSRSTSCSPRSTTTRSTRSGAWTSSCVRRRNPTTKRASCFAASIFLSAARGPRDQPERPLEDLNG